MSFQKWCGIGRIGKDLELKYTQTGKSYVKFSLATDETWNKEKKTTWHNIMAWGKQAELCSSYLGKGSLVYIEGRLEYSEYEKNGQKQYFTQIVLDKVVFLPSNKKDSQQGQQTQQNPMQQNMPVNDNSHVNDDIPF